MLRNKFQPDVFLRVVDFLAEHDPETDPDSASSEQHLLPPFVRQLADVTLKSAVTLHGTDLGTLQVVNPSGELELVSHRGFSNDYVEFFRRVTAGDGSACGEALKNRRRMFIEDIRTDAVFDVCPKCRETVLGSGAVSVQSTPIVAKESGRVLGMLSTHFRIPPDEEEVWDLEPITASLGGRTPSCCRGHE